MADPIDPLDPRGVQEDLLTADFSGLQLSDPASAGQTAENTGLPFAAADFMSAPSAAAARPPGNPPACNDAQVRHPDALQRIIMPGWICARILNGLGPLRYVLPAGCRFKLFAGDNGHGLQLFMREDPGQLNYRFWQVTDYLAIEAARLIAAQPQLCNAGSCQALPVQLSLTQLCRALGFDHKHARQGRELGLRVLDQLQGTVISVQEGGSNYAFKIVELNPPPGETACSELQQLAAADFAFVDPHTRLCYRQLHTYLGPLRQTTAVRFGIPGSYIRYLRDSGRLSGSSPARFRFDLRAFALSSRHGATCHAWEIFCYLALLANIKRTATLTVREATLRSHCPGLHSSHQQLAVRYRQPARYTAIIHKALNTLRDKGLLISWSCQERGADRLLTCTLTG